MSNRMLTMEEMRADLTLLTESVIEKEIQTALEMRAVEEEARSAYIKPAAIPEKGTK